MGWFLYLLGLTWIGVGSFSILYTENARKLFSKVFTTWDRRFVAIIPAAVGILLMLSAASTHHRGIVIFLGLLAAAKGVFAFLNPKNLYGNICTWYTTSAGDQTYQLHGIIALILGTTLLSWIV